MPALKTTLEDDLKQIDLTDFTGGLNSQADPQDLELNECVDCQNVYTEPGRLLGRLGFSPLVALPAPADGERFFFDTLGARHIIVWSNGNMYETTSGTLVTRATGCYTSGLRVAHTMLNGKLYYSEGITPIREYDPATSTDSAITSSGMTGSINIPAAKVLITYAGSIVAGSCTAGGVFEPQAFRWCNVNDPTTWLGVSIQGVGQGTGGEINAMSSMAVSDSGVSPFRAIWVGKSQQGIFGYQGGLGLQTEFLVPVDVGVLDGASATVITGPSGSSVVAWLGTDRRAWTSNGVSAVCISDKITAELSEYVQNQIQTKASPLFCGVRNDQLYHWILDVGDKRQYVYDMETKGWTRFDGLPSGYWSAGTDPLGLPSVYVASNQSDLYHGQALSGYTEADGSAINSYWTTGLINGGNSYRFKDFVWVYATYRTTAGGNVTVTMTEGPTADGSALTATSVFSATATAISGIFTLNQSLLDGLDVLDTAGGGNTPLTYRQKSRIACPVAGVYAETIPYETLKAADITVTIGQSGVFNRFEVQGIRLQYIWRGYAHVGQTF